jgi:tetrahydromethanopterin S-methyltransferase subunit D
LKGLFIKLSFIILNYYIELLYFFLYKMDNKNALVAVALLILLLISWVYYFNIDDNPSSDKVEQDKLSSIEKP